MAVEKQVPHFLRTHIQNLVFNLLQGNDFCLHGHIESLTRSQYLKLMRRNFGGPQTFVEDIGCFSACVIDGSTVNTDDLIAPGQACILGG